MRLELDSALQVLLVDFLETPVGLAEIPWAPSVVASTAVAIKCLVSVVVAVVLLVGNMFGGAGVGMGGFNGKGASGFGQQMGFGAQGGNGFVGIGGQGARGNFGQSGNNGFIGGQTGFGGAGTASGNAFGREGFNRRERQRRR
ncbi:unnamed protein product [Peronospora belbahrii]|uniref:Uncharacterized protein n=1 Tax=Peronospora belbahrii TaxID=622444 RepID=A0AAU9L994_9STRA|nr:unnamed protein product [Peronospora belbahrii]